MTVGESASISGVDADARERADIRRRLADVERILQRRNNIVVAKATHGFAGITSGGTPSLVAQLSAADLGVRGVPGMFYVFASAYLGFGGGPDTYELEVKGNGVTTSARINMDGASGWDGNVPVFAAIHTDGVVAFPIQLWLTRTVATTGGYGQFFGTDPRYVQLFAIFVPD